MDAPTVTTRRRRIDWTERANRPTTWQPVTPGLTLARVIERAANRYHAGRVCQVYLVGERPGRTYAGFLEWADAPPAGWQAAGHWLGSTVRPVLRYEAANGQAIEIHRAASWFGEGDYTATHAARALGLLGRVAGDAIDRGAAVLATPATTGRDWIARTLPHAGAPVLPVDAQQVVRDTSGQGRWALLTGDDGRDTLPGLWGYDMRFAYAALAWGLGSGLASWDDRPDWEPYARGRYRVSVTVPAGWDRVGLVGEWDGDAQRWRYPDQPGATFDTWADGAELLVAHRHGWTFDVRERMLWQSGKPLDRWAGAIVTMRDALGRLYRHTDYHPSEVSLAAAAARMVLIAGVGALHASGSPTTGRVPIIDGRADVPVGATDVRRAGEYMTYTVGAPPAWEQMAHPEWSAAIWARCRARLLTHNGAGALHVPRASVVALRQDAIYLDHDPRWPDDGKVGSFRPTLSLARPIPTPRTETELMEVRR